MNTQDIIHQAQDVFDRVTHRTSPLLPTRMEYGSNSVLTNITPPSALPSFLASPLPAPAPAPVSPALTPLPSTGPMPAQHTAIPPHPTVPLSVTSAAACVKPVSIPSPSGTPPQISAPAAGPPLTLATSPPVVSTTPASSTSYVPSSGPSLQVSSPPNPPSSQQNSIAALKGHSRHHSYPVYVPGNPIHNPPPPPTPPCLVVHQEQVSSLPLSKSYSQLNCSQPPGFYDSAGSFDRDVPGGNVQMNFVDHSVGFNYGYSFGSAGNVDASLDLGSPGVNVGPARPGWFGWIRGTVSNVGHKVAEKARSSMDTMITTLDPQMKEFIHSGGDMDIVVASDKEVKIGAVREAFQFVFGKATVVGIPAQSESVAAQPVGFVAALQSGEERINMLRSSGKVHPQQPVVSVENFIVELSPDSWYDMGLLLLDDPGEDIILQTYTQVTPVPPDFVSQAMSATQEDYPFRNTGFATTIGNIASQSLQVHHTLWQESLTGVPRRDLIVLAARTLAGLYKSRLPQIH